MGHAIASESSLIVRGRPTALVASPIPCHIAAHRPAMTRVVSRDVVTCLKLVSFLQKAATHPFGSEPLASPLNVHIAPGFQACRDVLIRRVRICMVTGIVICTASTHFATATETRSGHRANNG